MGGYASATSYDPNGTLRQLTSGPGGGGMVPGGMNPNALNGILAYKARVAEEQRAQENDRANRALSLQEWMARNAQAERDRNIEGDKSARLTQNLQLRRGTPVFTRTVGGAGITPGTMRLGAWQPGADVAGFQEDLGTGPANAVMSPVAGQAQDVSKGIAADEWNQYLKNTAARNRVPAAGPRY